jgi:hypothetical protein
MQGVRIARKKRHEKNGTKKNGARKDAVSGSKVVVVYCFDVYGSARSGPALRSAVRVFFSSHPLLRSWTRLEHELYRRSPCALWACYSSRILPPPPSISEGTSSFPTACYVSGHLRRRV